LPRNLGNKRNEISLAQIEEISRLHGEFTEGKFVKIFDNADFGYQQITVDRPLRLNFQVNDDRLARLKEKPAIVRLGESKKRKDRRLIESEISMGLQYQADIIRALKRVPVTIFKDREQFSRILSGEFKASNIVVPSSLFKIIVNALGESDPTANLCRTEDGKLEPDRELRDHEDVPLKQDIDRFLSHEVIPYLPDAFVDKSKTKIGYEINFNRYFFEFQPPRPIVEIEDELSRIEREIASSFSVGSN
jgi:type I restriction enzyme M protein